MNKNILIIVVAAVMVLSSLAVSSGYNSGSSALNPVSLPNVLQANTHVGNVAIYANGSVSNATEIGQNGNSYYLKGNLNGTLTDMRNNSAVSGNGFIINGMGKNGFNVTNASSVQISDFNVTNSTTGGYILNSKSVTVKDSHISAANNGILGCESDHLSISADRIAVLTGYGIYINYANEVSVNSTYIYATTGYYTDSSTNMTAFNNDTLSASCIAICFNGYSISNIVIANNTIRGNGTCPGGLFFSSYETNNVKIVGNTLENFTSNYAIYVDSDVSSVSSGYVISNNDFVNTSTSIYLFVFNAIITGNHFTNVTCYAIYAVDTVNIAVSGNTITNSSKAYFVYAEYSSDIKIQGNSISNTSTAIEFEYSSGITVSDNSIMKSQDDAVYLYSDYGSIDNVNVTGNAIKAGAYGIEIYAKYGTASNINISQNKLVDLTSSGIYIETESGKNYTLDNNTILNSSYPIYIFHVIQNIRIDGNRISNLSNYAIYLEYGSAASISGNVISGFSGTYQYGIDIEYSTEGVISNNIINGNSSEYEGLGILVYYSSEFSIFGNTVRNSTYGIYIKGSGSLSVFTNTVMNNPAEKETFGIYSYDNSQYSYYSNTVSGSNYSIYLYEDFNGLLYGNTFSNAHNYMISIYDSTSITLYHNNFLNGSRIKTYISGSSNLVWNLSLPVGGNYWSNYSGTGTDGIGSTPYKVNGTSVDYLPLTAKWEGYTITFVETGLPIGTAWSVTLGSSSVSSKTQTVVFSPYAAQHISQDFTVARISGYLVSESTGQITLNGASQVITLTFTPVKYNVTFTETGLPSGTSWSVTIGSQTLSSSGTINFSLPNGTYNYTVGSVTGYHVNTATGSFQINAAGKAISVTFVQNKYTLLVTETGLPAGDTWTVNVNGSTSTSTGNSIEVYLVSGTYNISITGPAGYNVTMSSHSVTIDNSNATISAVFKNTTVTAKTSNSGALYEGLGAGAVIGAVVGILGTMMLSGTGIFRKFGKGKGGTQ